MVATNDTIRPEFELPAVRVGIAMDWEAAVGLSACLLASARLLREGQGKDAEQHADCLSTLSLSLAEAASNALIASMNGGDVRGSIKVDIAVPDVMRETHG